MKIKEGRKNFQTRNKWKRNRERFGKYFELWMELKMNWS